MNKSLNVTQMRFLIHKSSGTAEVLLLPHKGTDQYSFVNLTKGHICPCRFNSIDEALKDLETRKQRGYISSYKVMEW